jgi:hypothetical protein
LGGAPFSDEEKRALDNPIAETSKGNGADEWKTEAGDSSEGDAGFDSHSAKS